MVEKTIQKEKTIFNFNSQSNPKNIICKEVNP